MVEHHVEHQSDAALLSFFDEFFNIFHRPVCRIDVIIVSHIVSVIILRRHEERCEPDVVRAQFFDIVQFFYNSPEISQSVPVGVAE